MDVVRGFEGSGERLLRDGGDADGADALDVRVPADREQAAAGATEPAACECHVGEGGDVVDAVLVVRESHRPEEDAALRLDEHAHGRVDLVARHAARLDQRVPRRGLDVREDVGEAGGVVVDEHPVEGVRLDDAFEQCLRERDVRADVRLEVEVGDLRAEQQALRTGGHAEPREAQLFERVHDDHLAAARPQVHELRDEAGVVARRVRARDEREVGLREVLERDGRSPRTEDAGEGDARRLVAVVGAVVDVRTAVRSCEQLEEERGFVAGATGGVEERASWWGVPECLDGAVDDLVPRGATEVRVVGPRDDREREPPEAFELRGREEAHLVERGPREVVLGDDVAHVAGGRLDGLLAELREVPRLVHHPAELPAHAEGARLARVPRSHPPQEVHRVASLHTLSQRVEDRGVPTASVQEWLRHAERLRAGQRGDNEPTAPALPAPTTVTPGF